MILEWGGIVEDLVLLNPHTVKCAKILECEKTEAQRCWARQCFALRTSCSLSWASAGPASVALALLLPVWGDWTSQALVSSSVKWGHQTLLHRFSEEPVSDADTVRTGSGLTPRKLPSHNLQLLFHTWSHHISLVMRKLTLWFPPWVASMHMFGTAFT